MRGAQGVAKFAGGDFTTMRAGHFNGARDEGVHVLDGGELGLQTRIRQDEVTETMKTRNAGLDIVSTHAAATIAQPNKS